MGLYICGFNTASHYTKKIMLKHSLDTVVSCYDEKNSIAWPFCNSLKIKYVLVNNSNVDLFNNKKFKLVNINRNGIFHFYILLVD